MSFGSANNGSSSTSLTTTPQLTTTSALLSSSNKYCNATTSPKSYGTAQTSSDVDSSQASDKEDDEFLQELVLRETLLSQTSFKVSADPQKGYRANEIKFQSFARPHMRTFHTSWICFLCAWFLWVSMTPLLPMIQEHTNISDDQLATTGV
jgi:hypothetical protein